VEIRRLSRLKSYVGDRQDFIFDTLLNFALMEKLEKRSENMEDIWTARVGELRMSCRRLSWDLGRFGRSELHNLKW